MNIEKNYWNVHAIHIAKYVGLVNMHYEYF